MYAHLVQFETQQLEFERQIRLHRDRSHARADSHHSDRQEHARSETSSRGALRYKLALLTWAGAYAVISVILQAFGPLMESWPLLARALLLSAMMVAVLTWVVMPMLTRLFRGWLIAGNSPSSE
jgi:antibiotic biosynthesis monooxygenase (ABM) superfamily enzyme